MDKACFQSIIRPSPTHKVSIMFTKLLLSSCLLITTAATAMTSQSNLVPDQEPTILLASNNTTWSFVAPSSSQGLSNVREFHDMGVSGVQQIDYVVNCANQTMAMSGFQILTGPGKTPVGFIAPKSQKLSFYTPVIEHDKKIASNTCQKLVALNNFTQDN